MCSFTVLGGGGPKTSQYLVWPPFASCSATHLLRIELIRLLIVACGILVQSDPQCWHQQTAYPQDAIHAVCPVLWKLGFVLWRTLLQSARPHRMWTFAHSSRLRRRTAVRSRPRWGRRACRWASLRWFLTVCAEIFGYAKLIVAAAVRVTGLRPSWRWKCWMWRSWAGVVTRALRLWGRLDALPCSLKHLWRRLMVKKWTFNSRATALVDIPAASMPITRSLKTCNICGIVL